MKFLYITFCICLFASEVNAAFVFRNGKLMSANEIVSFNEKEHYESGQKAMENSDWYESAKHFSIITSNFSQSEYYADSVYYLGISYFHQAEYDFANETFNAYLKGQNTPKYFEEAIGYKFEIAERLKAGALCRFFGSKKLPKWAPGKDLATQIYDEVISALPCHEYAARSLFAKGSLCFNEKEYREAVDAYQTLIRRFPKHELAPDAYLAIHEIYLDQSESEVQNPDLLALAQITLRNFKLDFPRDERIAIAEKKVQYIQEIYARGLYETGQFYERTSRPQASIIYYLKAIKQFPETYIAKLCQNRLSVLQPSTS